MMNLWLVLTRADAAGKRSALGSGPNAYLDPAADAALQRAREWIHRCVTSHKECISEQIDFVPTRLVRLPRSNTENAYLCSPGKPVGYAALTYCWGLTIQPMTTEANLEARYLSLDVDILPQTLQDALAFTKGLGLGYIWID